MLNSLMMQIFLDACEHKIMDGKAEDIRSSSLDMHCCAADIICTGETVLYYL